VGAAGLHRRLTLLGVLVCLGAACTGEQADPSTATVTSTSVASTITTSAPTSAPTSPTTVAPTTAPPTTAVTTTTVTTTVPTTAVAPTDVRHAYPVEDASNTSFGETHSAYPATDIFHVAGCGARLVSPVDGTVLEVRRDNEWDPAVDDPDTRGGRTVAILGDDGVRYYLAHFQLIDDAVQEDVRVEAGDSLGELGDSGRTSACHLHFGLSPVCETPEWWVRRGVIWPAPYLRDWRDGTNTSPVPEIIAWQAEHPDACTTPPGDAGDSG
jgi:murein DD-endopeptidase MepM/ murein hydrolase activator NlpD